MTGSFDLLGERLTHSFSPFIHGEFDQKTRNSATIKIAEFPLVRPERFELPTYWFVARHSIQLSYGRTSQYIITRLNAKCKPFCCIGKLCKIKSFYGFKKQQVTFAYFRVRSLRSIHNLHLLVTTAAGYIICLNSYFIRLFSGRVIYMPKSR